MPFVEVFSPAGSVSDQQRERISSRLVSEVMRGEGAPDTEAARSISWLTWHEGAWSIGGAPVAEGEPPRYVVRVTVPAGSLTDEKRVEIVRRVTDVLAEADERPERFRELPVASFVLLTEISQGNWGGAGRIVRFEDIASFVVAGAPGQLDADAVRAAFGLREDEPAPT